MSEITQSDPEEPLHIGQYEGAAPPEILVSVKLVDVRLPEVTLTWYVPIVAFAVNEVEVAMAVPELLLTEVVFVPLANVPLAPVVGAVNVTSYDPPSSGLPYWSSTLTINGTENLVSTAAL